jgi:hypothetical protein
MPTRLIIDGLTLYQHSRDKLRGLAIEHRTTGGMFGTIKTVDAMCRLYEPEVVIVCFGEQDVRLGDPRFAEEDAFDMLLWAKHRGFYTTWLKGGTAADTIYKVALDQLSNNSVSRLVVQTWNTELRLLATDKRVELVTKVDEPTFDHVDLVEIHGEGGITLSQSLRSGDLTTIPPKPDKKALRAFLSEFQFKSLVKELDEGKIKVIERKRIGL